jgi:hypothetical protein
MKAYLCPSLVLLTQIQTTPIQPNKKLLHTTKIPRFYAILTYELHKCKNDVMTLCEH